MSTYKVTRTLTVKVYDYITAESPEDAEKKASVMEPLVCEVGDVLNHRHAVINYCDGDKTIEKV